MYPGATTIHHHRGGVVVVVGSLVVANRVIRIANDSRFNRAGESRSNRLRFKLILFFVFLDSGDPAQQKCCIVVNFWLELMLSLTFWRSRGRLQIRLPVLRRDDSGEGGWSQGGVVVP